ncbi:MAG: hypothetical protein WAM39_29335 [Bryobacteraceae bacterium]
MRKVQFPAIFVKQGIGPLPMRIEAFSTVPAKPPEPDYRAEFISLPAGLILSLGDVGRH